MDKLVENSTIHGVTHIHMAKNKKVKIFWISLIILGFGGIVVNVGYVFDKYLKQPVEVSLTFEKTFEWPELTFCNPGAPFLVKMNSSKHIYWNGVIDKLVHLIEKTPGLNPVWDIGMRILMDSIDMQRFGFSYRDSLINFAIEGYNSQLGLLDFEKRYIIRNKMLARPYRLPCYSLKLRNTSLGDYRAISKSAFFLKLDQDSNKIFNKGYRPKSISMVINNVDESSHIKSYSLAPGYRYTFDISQSRYIHRESGKSCRTERFTTERYDLSMINTSLDEGTYQDCMEFHMQRRILDACKCYWITFPIHKNGSEFPRLCHNISLFTVEQYLENVKCGANIKHTLVEECEKYKLRKCDSKSYRISLYKEKLFEDSDFMDILGKRLLWYSFGDLFPEYVNRTDFIDVMRNSILQVVIRRENEFVDVRKEEYSYIFSQLLGDIGGLMGLCLGISVFGVFELAMLLYYFFKSILNGKKRVPKDVPLVNTTT